MERVGFRFMDFWGLLYAASVDYRHCAAWVRVGDSIFAHHSVICDGLIRAARFSRFENSLAQLHLAICRDRLIVGGRAFRVVQSAVNLTFRYPLNSILHNFTLSAIVLFVKLDGQVAELVETTGLADLIVAHYATRKWDNRAFWGQLRAIADTIDPFVSRARCPRWQQTVARANKATEAIVRDDVDARRKGPPRSQLLTLLKSPVAGKLVIWGMALLFIAAIYASCALSRKG
jgi:hypothetical protein